MISDGKKRHYIPVKTLRALFREIISTNNGGFYCLNCLHSFWTEIKLKSNEKSCKNHEVCNDIMPTEKNKRLAFTQYLKFIRVPFLICADLEALIKKY